MQEHDIKSQMQSKPSKYKILLLEKKFWGNFWTSPNGTVDVADPGCDVMISRS